jgi:hypothetical protein
MKAKIIRMALPAVLAVAALGVVAPTAGANSSVAPTSITFASNQTVGTTSAPQTTTVTVSCSFEIGFCLIPGSFVTGPVIAGDSGDFAQTNTCGTGVTSPGSCTFSVTFHPTATGVRTGTLTTGVDVTGSSPSDVSLTGSGVAAPAPTPATPTTTATGQRAAALKKCKKKKSKQARKKCKKKANKLPV